MPPHFQPPPQPTAYGPWAKKARSRSRRVFPCCAIVTLGAGMLVGSWLSGIVAQHYVEAGGHSWQSIWLITAIMGVALAVIFAVFYREAKHEGKTAP